MPVIQGLAVQDDTFHSMFVTSPQLHVYCFTILTSPPLRVGDLTPAGLMHSDSDDYEVVRDCDVPVQEMQKSRKVGLVVSLDLPSFSHAVLYNQTIVGPRHAGVIEDPSSPSASLLPLYDPEVGRTKTQHASGPDPFATASQDPEASHGIASHGDS